MPSQRRCPCKPKPADAHKPAVADLLSGSVVRAVMEADGVDPSELEAMLRRLATERTRRRRLPETL